jgi:hypothetical protein
MSETRPCLIDRRRQLRETMCKALEPVGIPVVDSHLEPQRGSARSLPGRAVIAAA